MWDATGNSSWTYDQYGRTTTATRVVDGRSYASDYTFDALDRVREMTYPDGEALTYSYQPNLLLDGIQLVHRQISISSPTSSTRTSACRIATL